MVGSKVADLLMVTVLNGGSWSRESTPHFRPQLLHLPRVWEFLFSNMLNGTHPVVLLKFLSYSFASGNNEPERRANNPHLSPW
jgi:hypothetical protein